MGNHQTPLHTKWGPARTASEVAKDVDLSGKVVIVTGGGSGLGLETTKVLSAAGATVVVAVRNVASARAALSGVPRIEYEELDLIDPASVDRFAACFLSSSRSLSILILNAGIMATPLFRDNAGNEGQFATNHLGHFRLAIRLWPALLAAGRSRIVTLSSRGHMIPGFEMDDLPFNSRPYEKWQAYGQSKTANALFAVAADSRGKENGIRAYSVHPGSIVGPLARHLSAEEIASFNALDESGSPIVDPTTDRRISRRERQPLFGARQAQSWRISAASTVRIRISHHSKRSVTSGFVPMLSIRSWQSCFGPRALDSPVLRTSKKPCGRGHQRAVGARKNSLSQRFVERSPGDVENRRERFCVFLFVQTPLTVLVQFAPAFLDVIYARLAPIIPRCILLFTYSD